MEVVSNFQFGLREAYSQLEAEGRVGDLDATQQKSLMQLCTMPAPATRAEMRRIHRRVRRLYIADTDSPPSLTIHWGAIVEWIKANWKTILSIILKVLPFLIL